MKYTDYNAVIAAMCLCIIVAGALATVIVTVFQ